MDGPWTRMSMDLYYQGHDQLNSAYANIAIIANPNPIPKFWSKNGFKVFSSRKIDIDLIWFGIG